MYTSIVHFIVFAAYTLVASQSDSSSSSSISATSSTSITSSFTFSTIVTSSTLATFTAAPAFCPPSLPLFYFPNTNTNNTWLQDSSTKTPALHGYGQAFNIHCSVNYVDQHLLANTTNLNPNLYDISSPPASDILGCMNACAIMNDQLPYNRSNTTEQCRGVTFVDGVFGLNKGSQSVQFRFISRAQTLQSFIYLDLEVSCIQGVSRSHFIQYEPLQKWGSYNIRP